MFSHNPLTVVPTAIVRDCSIRLLIPLEADFVWSDVDFRAAEHNDTPFHTSAKRPRNDRAEDLQPDV